MPRTLNVAGVNYTVPAAGDTTAWGTGLSDWMTAMTAQLAAVAASPAGNFATLTESEAAESDAGELALRFWQDRLQASRDGATYETVWDPLAHDIRDYGASTADAVGDDNVIAINLAASAADNGGVLGRRVVYIPPGTFKIRKPAGLSYNHGILGVEITQANDAAALLNHPLAEGSYTSPSNFKWLGAQGSELHIVDVDETVFDGGFQAIQVFVGYHDVLVDNITFRGENGSVDGTGYADTAFQHNATAIDVFNESTTYNVRIENCRFYNLWGFPTHARGDTPHVWVINCDTRYCSNGHNLNGSDTRFCLNYVEGGEGLECSGSQLMVTSNHFKGCSLGGSLGGDIGLNPKHSMVVANNLVESSRTIAGVAGYGFYVNAGMGKGLVEGNLAYNCAGDGFVCGDTYNSTMTWKNNVAIGCGTPATGNVAGFDLGGSGEHIITGNVALNANLTGRGMAYGMIVRGPSCIVKDNVLGGTSNCLLLSAGARNTYLEGNVFVDTHTLGRVALTASTMSDAAIAAGGLQRLSVSLWAINTAYSAGDFRRTAAGRVYLCTVAGTSAASGTGPTNTTLGASVVDGAGSLRWNYAGTTNYVVEATTSAPHGYAISNSVCLYGTPRSDPNYQGGLKIVTTVRSTTTFTYYEYGPTSTTASVAGITYTAGDGATLQAREIVTASATAVYEEVRVPGESEVTGRGRRGHTAEGNEYGGGSATRDVSWKRLAAGIIGTASGQSIRNGGAWEGKYRATVSTPATLAAEQYITNDATAGAKIINLPTATTCSGREYNIIKIDASGNTVTLTPNGAETINGAATLVLSAQWQSARLVSNGANWLHFTD